MFYIYIVDNDRRKAKRMKKTLKNYCKVEQLENKNQFIIKDQSKGLYYFQSYSSLVAVYDRNNGVLTLGCDWDYSNTTKKHLYIFIDEYCNSKELNLLRYAKNKKAYINDLIKTGFIKYDSDMQ